MNYRQKRIASGISLYTMAKELGIGKNKYKEVENNNLSLTGELLDKFMATLDKAKELNFNRLVKMKKVEEWFTSGQARQDMEQMGYTQPTLAQALGAHNTYVNKALIGKERVSEDFKEEMYDYLHNPLNKNLVVENKGRKKEKEMLRRKKEKKNNVIVSDVLVSEPTTTTIIVDAEVEKIGIDKDAKIKELEQIVTNQEEEIKYLKETINRIFKI